MLASVDDVVPTVIVVIVGGCVVLVVVVEGLVVTVLVVAEGLKTKVFESYLHV